MQAIELLFSHQVVSNSVTPWTVARQAPLFTGFPWQEYWSGLSFPSPGDLPNPEIKPMSPESSLPLSHLSCELGTRNGQLLLSRAKMDAN